VGLPARHLSIREEAVSAASIAGPLGLPLAQVFRFYGAADLCYVSDLHYGMNLVTKKLAEALDPAVESRAERREELDGMLAARRRGGR
jgi:hypothetical protein